MLPLLSGALRSIADTAEDAVTILRRLADPAYEDGLSEPRASDVDPADVAFEVFTQGDQSVENPFGLSALWIFWGQFLDHDIDLTPEQFGDDAELLKNAGAFSIVRSIYAGYGDDLDDGKTLRQQVNVITPEIDASNIYGSDQELQDALRTGEGGRLKVSEWPGGDLLATSDQVFGDGRGDFVSGDVRARENTALTSLHVTFVNEHNYWADRIAETNSSLLDEEIFQQARAVVEALVQQITYEEFLPILLGDKLPEYDGHKDISTEISNEFSTAAFRFGHTSIPDSVTYIDEDGQEARDPDNLFDIFFDSTRLQEDGIGNTLRGLLEERAQKIDTMVVDSLNFLLFTPDGLMGFSLPERNILRGRDHGLDTYLNVREAMVGDISAADFLGSTNFSIITSDTDLQAKLVTVYGTVDQVDLWVGGLAEDYAPGVTIGATFQAILVEQFTRLRDGDEFFYLNRDWDPAILAEIRDTQLSDILMRSGAMDYAQRDAMLASDRIGGTEESDNIEGEGGRDLIIGFGGNDRIKGHDGDDDLFGGDGQDWLNGGDGDDGLTGEVGHDHLFGGEGNDILSGGNGRDRLRGDAGADQFVFYAGEDAHDSVLDFEIGADLLVLKGYGVGFGDLDLTTGRSGAMVVLGDDVIAMLRGVSAEDLDADSFLFIG